MAVAAVFASLSLTRRELLWYLGTAGVLLCFTGLGYFIVWFATAPDDGRSIWPSWSGERVAAVGEMNEAAVPAVVPVVAAGEDLLGAAVPVLGRALRLLDAGRRGVAISEAQGRLPADALRLEVGVHNSLGMLMAPLAVYEDGNVVWMCLHETRLGDYESFIQEEGYTMMGELATAWNEIAKTMAASSSQRRQSNSGGDHPVSYLCADDAIAFCRWLTLRERAAGRLGKKDRYRLPTDAEWSLAAGQPEVQDVLNLAHGPRVREYVWGDAFPPLWTVGNLGLMQDGYAATAPVMQFSVNERGLYDVTGNVSEICVLSPGMYVRRGGSWCTDKQGELRGGFRELCASYARGIGVGFRCVMEVRAGE